MKPISLKITNFGPFKNSHEIDFSKLGNLFLVCGPTGSGKTTIFDAMSFALFGELPGSRKDLKDDDLRSKFASKGDMSGVDFVFNLHRKKYTVKRYLEYSRERSRGVGETVEPSTLGFTEDEVNLTENTNSKTDKVIVKKLGFTNEEFWKLIMLPQNEFQKFLESDTGDREKILKILFPAVTQEKVMTLVKDDSALIISKLNEIQNRIIQLESERDENASEIELKRYNNQLTESSKDEEILRKKISKLQLAEKQAKENNKLFDDFAIAEKGKKELEAKSEYFRNIEKVIEKALRASAIKPQYELYLDAQKKRIGLEEQISEGKGNLVTLEKTKCKSDLENKKIPSLQKELSKANKEIVQLGELVGLESEMVKNIKNFENKELTLKRKEEKYLTILEELNEIAIKETKVKIKKEDKARIVKLERESNKAGRSKLIAENIIELLVQKDEKYENQKKIECEIKNEEVRLAKNEKSLSSLKSEMVSSKAAELAALLEDNKPCPVCGSKEHPQIAGGAESLDFEKKSNILDGLILKSKKSIAGSNASVKGLYADIIQIKKDIKRKTLNIGIVDSETVKQKDIRDLITKCNEGINEYNKMRAEISRKEELIEELKNNKENKAKAKDILVKEINDLKLDCRSLDNSIKTSKSRLNGKTGIDKILKEIEAQSRNLSGLIEKIEKEYRNAQDNFKEASTVIAGLKDQLEQEVKKEENRNLDLLSAMKENKFQNIEQYKASLKENKVIRSMQNENDSYKKDVNKLEGEHAKLLNLIEGKNRVDVNSSSKQLEKLSGSLEEISITLKDCNENITLLNRHIQEMNNLKKELNDKKEKSKLLISLSKDLNGDNSLSVNFINFLLRYYLERVLIKTNVELDKLSDSRYELRLEDEEEMLTADRRKRFGLGVKVFDKYSQQTRPVKGLSGGEKFLTSLALAVGLSNEVQERSGGIILESMFIDEGFGTLDDQAKEKAIGLIDTIREGRMIGVISHVEELKNRIPSKIIVEKHASGSKIRIEN